MEKLKKGDKVAIVSLSAGVLGEKFVSHELELGVKRLKMFGLEPVFMPNSLKGIKFLSENPKARAEDLVTAFEDKSVRAIICAIGGMDTYRIAEFILNDKKLKECIKNDPKIFMGFSDTTVNHLMLRKLGLNTFYGPAFLTDFAELDTEMLPYTKQSINFLFEPKNGYEILPSEVWYEDRTDFSAAALNTPRKQHDETHGFILLKGSGEASGDLLGGCVDSFGSLLGIREGDPALAGDASAVAEQFNLLPTAKEWAGKIMFLETSENKMKPETLEKILTEFKARHYFDHLAGLIIGKPYDEVYFNEYQQVYLKVLKDFNFPVLFNLNFGHSTPRCIIPYGATAKIVCDKPALIITNSTIL